MPDGAVHAYAARGERPARILIHDAPGRMHEGFFTAIGNPVPDDRTAPTPPAAPPDVGAVIRAAEASGTTILPPPAA